MEPVSALRRKLALVLFLKHVVALAAAWGFVWGTVVLVARAVFGAPQLPLLWGLAAFGPVAAAAAAASRRQLPAERALRARVDQANRCGGLLMAAAETAPGPWHAGLDRLEVPALRWRGGRSALLMTASSLFVLVSFLGPWRLAASPARQPLDIGPEAAKLRSQIEVLREEKILEPDRSEALEGQLSALQKESDGREPGRTLEALDHVRNTVESSARESAERAIAATAPLARTAELADALSAGVKAEQLAEGMEALAALAAGEAKARALLDTLGKGEHSGALSREQLAGLAARLRGAQGELARRLEKLRSAGLIDLETLQKCRAAGECDGAGLRAFLAEHGSEASVSELVRLWASGGLDRGRGDALLTFADESRRDGSTFKDRPLPPAGLGSDSTLVALDAAAPEVDRGAPAAAGGALHGAAAGRGAAFTSTVLPRHRAAVKKFFERR